jgi:hypothetical protein
MRFEVQLGQKSLEEWSLGECLLARERVQKRIEELLSKPDKRKTITVQWRPINYSSAAIWTQAQSITWKSVTH